MHPQDCSHVKCCCQTMILLFISIIPRSSSNWKQLKQRKPTAKPIFNEFLFSSKTSIEILHFNTQFISVVSPVEAENPKYKFWFTTFLRPSSIWDKEWIRYVIHIAIDTFIQWLSTRNNDLRQIPLWIIIGRTKSKPVPDQTWEPLY